jgi:hypothetical protein
MPGSRSRGSATRTKVATAAWLQKEGPARAGPEDMEHPPRPGGAKPEDSDD